MINLEASWLTPQSISLIWTKTPSDVSNTYSGEFYVVQRSEYTDTEFVDISGPIVIDSENSFIDTYVPNYSKQAVFYYRIQRRNSSNSVLETSEVEHPRQDRPYIALEIIRLHNLLYRRFIGIRAFLFSKRSFGARCSECWDSIKERRSKSNCATCYGTSYENGYAAAKPILVSKNPTLNSKSVDVLGALEDVSGYFLTANYPVIRPGDVFVLDNTQFYRVDQVSPINFRETIVMQNLRATSIERSREINFLTIPSFAEFDSMDLIHRQYGGLSGDTLANTVQNTSDHGEFYLDKEGYKK